MAVLAVLSVVLTAFPARAYDALLTWRPVAGAAGYIVYVRYGNEPFGPPAFLGQKVADGDGLIRHTVTGVAMGPTATFAVSSYDAAEVGSSLSNELSITYAQAAVVVDSDGDGLTDAQEDVNLNGIVDPGESDPNDASSPSNDPCARGTLAEGDACDDGLSCTGGDVCQAGVCTGADLCTGDYACNAELDACRLTVDANVWLAAADASTNEFSGNMVLGGDYANGGDLDPNADSIGSSLLYADSLSSAYYGGSGDSVRYPIDLPETADWYLWGRFYYPGDGTENSFFVSVDGGSLMRFGNNTLLLGKWHWDGDGSVEYGEPTPLALGTLSAGHHELVVEKREAGLKPPQLDIMMLTRDPNYVPRDGDAISAFTVCGDGVVGPGEMCDAGPANGSMGPYSCTTECKLEEACGDATDDIRITATDAAVIQRRAVGSDVYCPFSRCDVNGNGIINATDAFAVLRRAIGGSRELVCGLRVYVRLLDGGADYDSIGLDVDYGTTSSFFIGEGRAAACKSLLPDEVHLVAQNSIETGSLHLDMDILSDLQSPLDVAVCRFYAVDELPAESDFVGSVSSYVGRNGAPAPAPRIAFHF